MTRSSSIWCGIAACAQCVGVLLYEYHRQFAATAKLQRTASE